MTLNITLPVGRIVDGSLYDPQTQDAEGKPLVFKNGPNAGQPRANFYFAVAIPKNPGEQHWAHAKATRADGSINDWGAKIWAEGNAAFPNIAQSPAFAWKIEDGDSQIPNKRGRKNSEREGYPGNWILKLSGGYAPRVYQQQNGAMVQVVEKDFCKPGYFVEVNINVDGNGSAQQPGIYLNHSMVCFRAYGPEIVFGPDVNAAGFGQSALPPGASAVPTASNVPMPSAPAPLPQGGFAPPPGAPAPAVAATIPVIPNTQFAQVPPPAAGVAAPPPVVQAPPAPAAKQMTALATTTYDEYVKAGWTDALLIQHGLMLP